MSAMWINISTNSDMMKRAAAKEKRGPYGMWTAEKESPEHAFDKVMERRALVRTHVVAVYMFMN